jgi:hypothetical protein
MEVEAKKSFANHTKEKPSNAAPKIDCIYYLTLEKNGMRRMSMELWLQQQPIPYK